MKGFCPLASGSKGNSIYIGTENTKILIDVGISYNKLKDRLEKIDVNINEIEAILITHEHLDHIEGLKTICSKLNIPVLTNSETAKGIYEKLHVLPKFKIFTTDESFEFKDLLIHPFSIQHDTLDPVAFTIQTRGLKIGVCADLGFVTTLVKTNLQDCDYLYLETNHDVNMLYASKRPDYLKKRIRGRQGHLSNEESIELLNDIINPKLKHIHLAHLSGECNSMDLAKKTVEDFLLKKKVETKVSIAFQDKISNPILF
jgi:phosphoribosyl 1,2-cyclic phosphodiesterase